MAKCGAKTRDGKKCKRNAMLNGRCNLHGGKSTGAPPEKMKGNRNAMKWGFFSKHIEPEQLAIMQEFDTYDPADILWQNILIAYSTIIRAQKLMFVRDQKDVVQNMVKQRSSDSGIEEQYEFQYPWDRHANFMQAQARAQSELRSLIKDFLAVADEADVRRLKIDAMQKEIELKQAQINKLNGPAGEEQEDDGFMDALHAEAGKVWDDNDSDDEPTEES